MRAESFIKEYPLYLLGASCDDGRIEIATRDDGVIATLKPTEAETIVNHREALIMRLLFTMDAFEKAAPDAFNEFIKSK